MSGSLEAPVKASPSRRCWHVLGQVQGVGYRPFVHRLASRHHLTGLVRNTPAGLHIEAQGPPAQLLEFDRALRQSHPPLARVREITWATAQAVPEERGFTIMASALDQTAAGPVTADVAICPQCLRELADPADRRYRYGLINCTDCGPRYTIIRGVPYDRPRTTMAGFQMCRACQEEYDRPDTRRFHAQPTACPACGPRVELVDRTGTPLAGDPYVSAARRIAQGQILALKGLGGFHLAVRADDAAAVARLRQAKQRDTKPLALMVANVAAAQCLVQLSAPALESLASPVAPIILAQRRPDIAERRDRQFRGVAQGTHRLGVMLPYTPVHHLIFRELGDAAPPLVMTSANLSDEPLVTDNDQALTRLAAAGLCDAILWHNRPIARPIDDSVLLDMGPHLGLLPVRRARGLAPGEIELAPGRSPGMAPAIGRVGDAEVPGTPGAGLCLGGELKSTVAVVRDGRVVLSQHLGDLTHARSFEAFVRAVEDLLELYQVQPRWIAHDQSPVYASTLYARELARRWGLAIPGITGTPGTPGPPGNPQAPRTLGIPRVPATGAGALLGVQHHHAHAAALLAEHGREGPILAVVCDGTGFGADGTSWGGELLWVTRAAYRRLGHLRPLSLPGGDAAARDTRRCALAMLTQALGPSAADHPAARHLVPDTTQRQVWGAMLARGVQCITSSGCGRQFDGAAALLGLCLENQFEAQAGLVMEAAAWESNGEHLQDDWPAQIGPVNGRWQIDLSPLTRGLITGLERGVPVPVLAAHWHDQLAAAWARAVERVVGETGLRTIGLTGGVFCNQRLTAQLAAILEARGLTVLRHHLVPPNDGGIALGQAAVAARRLAIQRFNKPTS